MQWTPDRNAGFSTADPGKLYLPVISSLVFNSQAVNVESQLAQPSSLLHWLHGILDVRRQHPVLGDGDFKLLEVDNEAILAFTRTNATETMVCIINMANTPRSGTVKLGAYSGWHAADVLGGAGFPRASEHYTVTLGARDFLWLSLTPPGSETAPLEGLPADAGDTDIDFLALSRPSHPESSI